jgi:hypothetical protein
MQLLPSDQELLRPALELLTGRTISDEEWAITVQELQSKKNKVSRNFRIEVDADSLVQIDEDAQKADRLEFIEMVSKFLQQAVPAAQSQPELAPVLVEILKFGVSAFKAGKTLEGMIDNAAETLTKQVQQQANQPKPPPIEIQKVQAESQARIQEKQAGAQMDMQMEQHRTQLESAKLQQEGQIEMLKAHLEQQTAEAEQRYQAQQAAQETAMEMQRDEMERQSQERLAQMQAMLEADKAERDRQFQMLIAAMNNQVKLEVAEIGAQTTLEASQISAAKSGSEE